MKIFLINEHYIPSEKVGSKSLKFVDRHGILDFYQPRVKENNNNRQFLRIIFKFSVLKTSLSHDFSKSI